MWQISNFFIKDKTLLPYSKSLRLESKEKVLNNRYHSYGIF